MILGVCIAGSMVLDLNMNLFNFYVARASMNYLLLFVISN